jgi:hypothetical protein
MRRVIAIAKSPSLLKIEGSLMAIQCGSAHNDLKVLQAGYVLYLCEKPHLVKQGGAGWSLSKNIHETKGDAT